MSKLFLLQWQPYQYEKERKPALLLSSRHCCQKLYEYQDVLHIIENEQLNLSASKMAIFQYHAKF